MGTKPASGPLLETDDPLQMGNNAGNANFEGRIDEVRIYSVPLTPAEIQIDMSGAASQPPVVTDPGPQEGSQGTAVSLPITASDPDGDPLSYSASGLPPGLAIDPVTGVISGNPTTPGVWVVLVTVTDTSSASDSTSFIWTVVEQLLL